MTVESTLKILQLRSACEVLPAAGIPSLKQGMNLPPEVEEFYRLCGGVKLGVIEDDFWAWQILPPDAFRPAPAEVFQGYFDEEQGACHWTQCFHIMAENQNAEERIVVSCGERCFGLFFDGHQESFGCDDMRLIARDLPELLLGLADAAMGRLPRPDHPSQQIFLSQL